MSESDEPEVRVFDSVSAAIANSRPPEPPPYAEIHIPQTAVSGPETAAPVQGDRKTSKRRTPARTAGLTAPVGTTATAGTAGVDAKAQDPA